MGNELLKEAVRLLRSQQLFPATIRKAQELVISSGQRINEINVALYYSEKGDISTAKLNAGKAADAITRLIRSTTPP